MMTQDNAEQTMRLRLQDLGFQDALRALGFAATLHTGFRRNGSPEFSHQLEIAEYILDLEEVEDLEEILVVVFLHDTREDYGVADCAIRSLFGGLVADAVARVTKSFLGVVIPDEVAFLLPVDCPLAAITKGVDRIQNLRTMDGAFDAAKQASYRLETRSHIIPMLRAARQRHASHVHILDKIVLDLVVLSTVALDQTQPLERITYDA
jgi:(p)ppGpp synthase/HD superfamily hydrolase